MKRLALILTVILTAGLVRAEEPLPRRTLVVTGTAEVTVAPDICYMSFVVETNSKKAGEAYQENIVVMNRINSAVKAFGVESKDMRTTNFSVTPIYRYTDRKRIFESFQVYNTLNISVRDLGKVSDILDAAIEAGATDLQGVTFTVEQPKKHTEDARREALKAARAKAEESAEILGFRLGTPISVSESEPGSGILYAQTANVYEARGGYAADQLVSGPTLEAGEIKLSRTVYVTFEIEPLR